MLRVCGSSAGGRACVQLCTASVLPDRPYISSNMPFSLFTLCWHHLSSAAEGEEGVHASLAGVSAGPLPVGWVRSTGRSPRPPPVTAPPLGPPFPARTTSGQTRGLPSQEEGADRRNKALTGCCSPRYHDPPRHEERNERLSPATGRPPLLALPSHSRPARSPVALALVPPPSQPARLAPVLALVPPKLAQPARPDQPLRLAPARPSS